MKKHFVGRQVRDSYARQKRTRNHPFPYAFLALSSAPNAYTSRGTINYGRRTKQHFLPCLIYLSGENITDVSAVAWKHRRWWWRFHFRPSPTHTHTRAHQIHLHVIKLMYSRYTMSRDDTILPGRWKRNSRRRRRRENATANGYNGIDTQVVPVCVSIATTIAISRIRHLDAPDSQFSNCVYIVSFCWISWTCQDENRNIVRRERGWRRRQCCYSEKGKVRPCTWLHW